MTDNAADARRRQLMAAVTMLTVSLGMSSEAVANQKKEGLSLQNVARAQTSGGQHSLKHQSSIKSVTRRPSTQDIVYQHSIKNGPYR